MSETSQKHLKIDTDVHEHLIAGRELLPYLAPVWKHFITQYGWNKTAVGSGFPYPGGHTAIKPSSKWTLDDGTVATDPGAVKRHLFEQLGVTHAILGSLFHIGAQRGSYEFASALASAYNDWQIATWLESDPRFLGSIHIVPDNPLTAAREIDRVAAECERMVQVLLPTVTDIEYGAPQYRPIFEAAARNGLAVALHHGRYTRTVLGYPRNRLEWHVTAAPQAAINQLLCLIGNGIFEDYPSLRICLLEVGSAWLPWFMWRVDQQFRESREEVPWVKRLPSSQILTNVRVSIQPVDDVPAAEFAKLVAMTQSDEMYLFASNYPYVDVSTLEHSLWSQVSTDLRARIEYANALATYPRLPALVA